MSTIKSMRPETGSLAIIEFMMEVMPEPNTGCWLWDGNYSAGGYGVTSLHGKSCGAHRVSWKLFKGDPPNGEHVDHLCRVRCCVNPDHLELVSQSENTRRMVIRRREAGETKQNRKKPQEDWVVRLDEWISSQGLQITRKEAIQIAVERMISESSPVQ